jgi:hypothetical protein
MESQLQKHKIILSAQEWDHCHERGSKRQGIYETATNVNPKKYSDENAIGLHIQGFIAEYAYCKWRGCPLDMTTNVRVGGFDTISSFIYPLYTNYHARTDIKTTIRTNGNLLVPKHINTSIDVFVATRIMVKDKTVEFIGWLPASEVYVESNIRCMKADRPCYVVSWQNLYPFNFQI